MADSRRIRIVIADDHTVVREGVEAIINQTPDMSVIAEAGSWPEAIEKVMECKPEVALVDLRMPGMRAIEGVSILHKECAGVGIVLLSAFDADEEVYGAIRAGARGFLLKDCTRDELRECVRVVHEGKNWLARGPAAKLAARVHTPELTQRQIEILTLVTEGKTNKEVGALLNVTEGTVKVHVNHIFGKLGVGSRTAAITRALQRGIVLLSKSASSAQGCGITETCKVTNSSSSTVNPPADITKDIRTSQAKSELNPKT
jgi:two-component system, NarL family, response regulator